MKRWNPRRIKILLFLLLLLGASRLLPRIPAYPEGLKEATPPYLTIFLIDGLGQNAFEQELRDGSLPNIERLIHEGTLVTDGIAAFPSMTGYTFYPFLTGADAAESGLIGLRWFDRSREAGNFRNYVGKTYKRMNQDFKPLPRMLFEEFPTERTSSVNSYANRGVARSLTLGWAFTMAKYQDNWWVARFLSSLPWLGSSLAPNWLTAEEQVLETALADLALKPKIQWIAFPSPDGNYHIRASKGAPSYRETIRCVDRMIGLYREESARLGLESQRIYAVLSDHGMVEVRKNLDLGEILHERFGLRIFRGQATYLWNDDFLEPLDTYQEQDGILAINGNTAGLLYFRNPSFQGLEGWKHRLAWEQIMAYPLPGGGGSINLAEALLGIDGVELVAARGEQGRNVLMSRTGRATLEKLAGGWAYTPMGTDPLGYREDEHARAVADGLPHSAEEWLEATHSTLYPFGAVRLHQLLSQEASGDLLVTMREGYDLAKDFELFVGNYQGGHGGLRADQLRVPFILAGPGVPRGKIIATALSEEVGATLRGLLGVREETGAHRLF